MTVNLELCADGVDGAALAAKYGFKRIELCSALAEGGLTPSYGMISECQQQEVEVHAMIRPTGGSFHYQEWALDVMCRDIDKAAEAGARGVVFGILDTDGQVSEDNKRLVDLAKSRQLEVTFHRAFDLVPDPYLAMDRIVNFGFDRVLSSGQAEVALKGLDLLSELQNKYGDKVQLMAGSGVGPGNAVEIAAKGLRHLHFSARKKVGHYGRFGMGDQWVADEDKMRAVSELFR